METMPFKYACFISYCHGQFELTKSFVQQLKVALKAELEPMLDEEVYIDEERLKPGFNYNEELAKAICQSVCMIVIYSPRYERHLYCLREFAAMELIEESRRRLLNPELAHGRGFIIPIIFRGNDDLPIRITSSKHYVDFSKFTLATSDISRNPEYIEEIQKIAKIIYEHYKAFDDLDTDPCNSCTSFALPKDEQLLPWRDKPKKVSPSFPGRGD
jgi:TIR domain